MSSFMISDSTLSDGDQILPYLFLGSSYAASNDKPFSILGITHIVNATLDIPCLYEGPFTYLMVEVEDDAEVPIGDSFAKAHEFIEEARKSGGKVLVHCRAGISRSASLVLAHMLLSRAAMGSPITLRDAVAHAKARRACVSPNEGFMAQLCALEERLTGAVTVDIGKYKPRRFGAVQEYAIGEVQTLTWEV